MLFNFILYFKIKYTILSIINLKKYLYVKWFLEKIIIKMYPNLKYIVSYNILYLKWNLNLFKKDTLK